MDDERGPRVGPVEPRPSPSSPAFAAEGVPIQTRSSDPMTSAPAAAATALTTPTGTSCRPPACHGEPPLASATSDTSSSPIAMAAIARTSLRGLTDTARSSSIRFAELECPRKSLLQRFDFPSSP
jgi:hypothetical protein